MNTAENRYAGVGFAMSLFVLLFINSTDAFAGKVNSRQHHQQARIRQGVVSGELTAHEARRLEHQQGRIRRAEARAKSDGEFTVRERRKLNRKQDRARYNVYRQKHDGQER